MEEDIKILEELKKDFISLISKRNGFVIERDKREKEVRALENLLTRYKQLEEENEKLNQLKEKHNVRINDLCALVDNFAYNSIPVSLVKEKIEELEKKDKVINEMAKQLVEAHGWFYSEFDNFTEKNWIDYFTRKVEREGK